MNTPSREIEIVRFDAPVPYDAAYELQVARRKAIEADELGNALFVLEHQPVITLGRDTDMTHLLLSQSQYGKRGIAVHEIDRGGDVTYHGPGQLTAYPLLNLSQWKCSVRWYLRSLEEVLIRTLAVYGLNGEREEGLTGVWVDGAKVAQVGVGLRNWVTFHGIALNVNPDMGHFGLIVPCGIHDKPVTSLDALLTDTPSLEVVADEFTRQFMAYFNAWTPENDPVASLCEAPAPRSA